MNKEKHPLQNETVFFKVKDDNRSLITCFINNTKGWHMGWWSGSRWHSHLDEDIKNKEIEVEEWKRLGIDND